MENVSNESTQFSSFSFYGIPAAVNRHKLKSLLFFGSTVVLAALFVLFAPRKYNSEAKLFVRIGRESVALDPTATTGQTVAMQVSRREEINSVMDILTSRGMAERVVDDVTPKVILRAGESNWLLDSWQDFSDQLRTLSTRFTANGTSDVAQAREEALALIEKMLGTYAAKQSNVISVSCEARSPEVAQQIVASLVSAYRDEHARFNRTVGSAKFFEEQAEILRGQLQETTHDLRDLKNKKGIVSIQAQLQLLEAQKMEIEAEQLRVSRELASSEGKMQALTVAMKKLDELILAGKEEGHSNEAADQMRSQLYELEMRERKLSARYKEDHPYVVEIRKQFADVRKILDRESGARTHSRIEVNPNWQRIQLSLLETNADHAAHTKTIASLARQHAEVVEEIRQLNNYALQIDELQRQIDLQQDSYRTYRDNFEQARIDAALEDQHITNVNVVQPATFSPKPVAPNKKLAAVIGLLVAVFGAIGVALVAESCDQRLKSPEEVEAALSLPVLVSVPNSSKQCVHV